MMIRSGDDRQSQTFAALANSTRQAILARLAEREATVNELAEPFEMSLPAISKHIKVLESAGLIAQGQKAQYRPCKNLNRKKWRKKSTIHSQFSSSK